jgi:hypothetical protein
MLSTPDVEFEPEQAKVWQFSSSIFALVAGDTSIQAEVLKRTHIEVQDWITKDPKTWVKVRDVASLYCKRYRELLRERAEAKLLNPIGLTIPSFLASQTKQSPDVVANIVSQLTDFDFNSIQETIFIGKDQDGPTDDKGGKLIYPQLYATYGDKLSYLSSVGFAAIGVGKSHAESQLMFSGHSPWKSFEETLLVTYLAKKRAEVAPGVGKKTDVVIIGPNLGENENVSAELIESLDRIYQTFQQASDSALAVAKRQSAKLVHQVRKDRAKNASVAQSQRTATANTSKPSTSRKSQRAK